MSLRGGAPRVLIRTLPLDAIDRIVVPGINADTIDSRDRMVSAASPTTSALCLLLHILSSEFVIERKRKPSQNYQSHNYHQKKSF